MIGACQYDHEVGRCVAVPIYLNDGVSPALKPGDATGSGVSVLTTEGERLVSA